MEHFTVKQNICFKNNKYNTVLQIIIRKVNCTVQNVHKTRPTFGQNKQKILSVNIGIT